MTSVRRGLRVLSVAAGLMLGGAAVSLALGEVQAPLVPVEGAGERGSGEAAPGYAAAVRDAQLAVERAERLVGAAPQSWIRRGQLAAAQLHLARLTGSYDAFGRADEAVAAAFALNEGRVGPSLVRAQLNFALHRFHLVEEDLVAAERLANHQRDMVALSQIGAMRARLAMELGRYGAARETLNDAVSFGRTFEATVALAELEHKLGNVDEARGLYVEATTLLADDERQSLAWVELQLGELELGRGANADARAHYLQALARFPGWWLIEEHIAALDALEGRTAEAIEVFERLAGESGAPEHLDALAALIARREPDRARALVRRARDVYTARSGTFPEAMVGHAVRHYLDHEEDPEPAVALAEKNFALRPNPQAAALLVEAYLEAGRTAAARELLAGSGMR